MPFILIRGGSADIWCNENMLNILYWIAEFFPIHCITEAGLQPLPPRLSVCYKGCGLNKWEMESDTDVTHPSTPVLVILTFRLPSLKAIFSVIFRAQTWCLSHIEMERGGRSDPKIWRAVWCECWGILSSNRFCTILMNPIHKNPQEILLINNVMNVKEMRLILEGVDYYVAIMLGRTTILKSHITGLSPPMWWLLDLRCFFCLSRDTWLRGQTAGVGNVSNTCVNTCFWLRYHKPEGALKNII